MTVASREPEKARRHAKLGLASVWIAVTTGFVTLLLLVISAIPESGSHTAQRLQGVLLVFFLTAPILYLAGLVMGIVGAFRRDARRVFAVLGIVFNIVPLGLYLVGACLLLYLLFTGALFGGWH